MVITHYGLAILAVLCFIIAALPHKLNVRFEWLGAAALAARLFVVLAVLTLIGSTGACAKARHLAVQVDATVATAVFAVDDAEFAMCQAHTLSQAQCDSLNPKIKAALQDVKAVTAAIQATPSNGAVPKSLPDLIQTLRNIQAIGSALPASDATGGLVQRVNTALDAAIALLSKIAGN